MITLWQFVMLILSVDEQGGCREPVTTQLSNSPGSVAALCADGHVVSWGACDSSKIQDLLGVTQSDVFLIGKKTESLGWEIFHGMPQIHEI